MTPSPEDVEYALGVSDGIADDFPLHVAVTLAAEVRRLREEAKAAEKVVDAVRYVLNHDYDGECDHIGQGPCSCISGDLREPLAAYDARAKQESPGPRPAPGERGEGK